MEFLKYIYNILHAYTSINFKPSVNISWKLMEYSQNNITLKYWGSKTGARDFSNFAKSLNVNYTLIKQLYSHKQICKDWKKLVALCRWGSNCWWQLLLADAEETSLCNEEMILWTKVHYSTIWSSLPHCKIS